MLEILDGDFQVTPRGMTFKTNSYFDPFTSLHIRFLIPAGPDAGRGKTIECEGAVVECRGDHKRKIFYVSVAFLGLSSPECKLVDHLRSRFAGEWRGSVARTRAQG